MELTFKDHRRNVAGLTYIYPVLSRRAGGVSLGINLNPNNACNWHCAYCQVEGLVRGEAPEIDVALLIDELHRFLAHLHAGDYARSVGLTADVALKDIAFSGNGEPTSAKDFAGIVRAVLAVRAREGLVDVPLRLITNGSLLGQAAVREGIAELGRQGGEVWFKLDAATREDALRINGVGRDPARAREDLERCAHLCPTWVQTCVFCWDGEPPSAASVDAYVALLREMPAGLLRGVHLYGVARPSCQPEAVHLAALPEEGMQAIARRLKETGLTVTVSP